MIDRTYSIAEIQEKFIHMPEQFEQEPGALIVTQHDKPVMAILPFNIYKDLLETVESLQETLEILSDEELMASFREGVKALENGETIPLEDALKELGWE
jgi:PHD/YefM family antitoxin component YafN of YafNO toxin-antitoxin module